MGSARLLLVDDEAALVELLKKFLERLGYDVDTCLASEDALALFEEDPHRYALVLTDLTLPGINGEQMLDRMRLRNPRLRAVVSSGYPYHSRTPQIEFLQKPYLPRMLAEAIEKMLNTKPA